MNTHLRTCAAIAALLVPLAPGLSAADDRPVGIGVMGDSYSDEYQFYTPHRNTARNWVEILAETRGLNFGRLSLVSRGEPRNQGYEYNWARSDATTESLIATGQHTGLAAQVARGDVSIVFVFIGGNDFINATRGPDPAAAAREVLPRAMGHFRTAVETVRNASPNLRLVLSTLPDIRDLPEFAAPIRDGRLSRDVADTFTDAMRKYNAHVRAIAGSDPRTALMDFERMVLVANLFRHRAVRVAGLQLDREVGADDVGHFFLADDRHPGTLANGMVAILAVETLKTRFGLKIAPLRDVEVVEYARRLPRLDAEVGLAGLAHPASTPVTAHTGAGAPAHLPTFEVVPVRAP